MSEGQSLEISLMKILHISKKTALITIPMVKKYNIIFNILFTLLWNASCAQVIINERKN